MKRCHLLVATALFFLQILLQSSSLSAQLHWPGADYSLQEASPSPSPDPHDDDPPTPNRSGCGDGVQVRVLPSRRIVPEVQDELRLSFGQAHYFLQHPDEVLRLQISIPRYSRYDPDTHYYLEAAQWWEYHGQRVDLIPVEYAGEPSPERVVRWGFQPYLQTPDCADTWANRRDWERIILFDSAAALAEGHPIQGEFEPVGDHFMRQVTIPGRYLMTSRHLPLFSTAWQSDIYAARMRDHNQDWYLSSEDDYPVLRVRFRAIAFDHSIPDEVGYAHLYCPNSCGLAEPVGMVDACSYAADAERPKLDQNYEPLLDENGNPQREILSGLPHIAGEVIPIVRPAEKRLWRILSDPQYCRQLTWMDVKTLSDSGIGERTLVRLGRDQMPYGIYSVRYGKLLAVFLEEDGLRASRPGEAAQIKRCVPDTEGPLFVLYGVFAGSILPPPDWKQKFDADGNPIYSAADHGAHIVEVLSAGAWRQWYQEVTVEALTTATYLLPFGSALDLWQQEDYWGAARDGVLDLSSFGLACKIKTVRVVARCTVYGIGGCGVAQNVYNVVANDGGAPEVGRAALTLLEVFLATRTKADDALSARQRARSYDLRSAEYKNAVCRIDSPDPCAAACSPRGCPTTLRSAEEIDKAQELVYRVYLQEGYIEPNPSQRFVHRAAQTNPSRYIGIPAADGGLPEMAATVIKDGVTALPVERYFAAEVAELRRHGTAVGEIGSFASRNKLSGAASCTALGKKDLDIMIQMMGRGVAEARALGIRHLVLGADPGHVAFYKRLFGMTQHGDIRNYSALNGREVGMLSFDLQALEDPETVTRLIQRHIGVRAMLDAAAACPIAIDPCPAGMQLQSVVGCCAFPELDTDRDQVPDCEDGCPGDPQKTEPGACGCGAADSDADQNGVADCLVETELRGYSSQLEQAVRKLKPAGGKRAPRQAELRAEARRLLAEVEARVKEVLASVSPQVAEQLQQQLAEVVRRVRAALRPKTAGLKRRKKAACRAITALGALLG